MKKEEKEVHVFRYSQLISTERRLTISEFSDHSGLSMQAVADIAINEEKSNGIIDQYKKGNLTTEEFRNKINKLIESSDGKAITDNKIFDNCWNSMCIVEPENLTKLYNLQEKHNLHIHVIGGTN